MVKTILSGNFSIFSETENEKTLDFRHFVELTIELENRGLGVGTTDVSVCPTNKRS